MQYIQYKHSLSPTTRTEIPGAYTLKKKVVVVLINIKNNDNDKECLIVYKLYIDWAITPYFNAYFAHHSILL